MLKNWFEEFSDGRSKATSLIQQRLCHLIGQGSSQIAPSPLISNIPTISFKNRVHAGYRLLAPKSRVGSGGVCGRMEACQLRQNRRPSMSSPFEPPIVFCTCQPGAEKPLKQEIAARRPGWRLAFSRPGFVSFKCDESEGAVLNGALPTFARTRSISLGRTTGESIAAAADQVWGQPGVQRLFDANEVVGLHVWQRDTLLPGEDHFEPAVTPLAKEAKAVLLDAARSAGLVKRLGMLETAAPPSGSLVLDVVLVEPNQWYIGWHRASSRVERWAGGMLPVAAPQNMVSRAYLKMEEALKWSALPATKDDVWVELGCAPGGASQALLNRGFTVIGVDPAEVDEPVASNPNFLHLKKRSADVKRAELAPATWLAADLNVAPQYTLDAVADVVQHPSISIRGVVLTLKLSSWEVASPAKLEAYIGRVRSWGLRDVRLRQLVHNRHELCLVALGSRGQRRMKRSRKRPTTREAQKPDADSAGEVRFDAPTRMVPPHHFR